MISLQDVTKQFHMGQVVIEAIKAINIEISQNEYIAISGPSGSGKSTLMNILGCLETPTLGKFLFHGSDVSAMDDDELADIRNTQIGFIFQNFNLMPRLSVLKNVTLPLLYSRHTMNDGDGENRARALLKEIGLEDRLHHRPSELSGGQQQRVAIARALINEPALILADEPTGNLDSQTSQEILQLFRKLHGQGHTIVLVTHEKDIAQHTQRLITLFDGKIVYDRSQCR